MAKRQLRIMQFVALTTYNTTSGAVESVFAAASSPSKDAQSDIQTDQAVRPLLKKKPETKHRLYKKNLLSITVCVPQNFSMSPRKEGREVGTHVSLKISDLGTILLWVLIRRTSMRHF